MAIDWNFLQQVEGKENTTYIPMSNGKVIQNSGVTIGTGVDLGQQTAARFKKLGVAEDIIEKLKPFFGKSQDSALKALERQGEVTLSDEEVFAIDEALKRDTLKRVKSWYNKDNKVGQDWSDLSDRQQTVVLSTFYNHGLDGAPNFKKQVETGDWTKAIENLRNFYSSKDNELHTRRVKEAQYLAGLPPEQIDGIDGSITAAAVEEFKNTVGVSTPDQVQPQQPQIGSMGYIDNIVGLVRSSLESPQRASQTPSRSDTSPTSQQAGSSRERIEEREQQLTRTANEAQLGATAREVSTTTTEFTPEEEALINSAVAASIEQPTPTERLSHEFTPFEEQLIATASGTEEAESPVYTIEEESNEQERIRTLF